MEIHYIQYKKEGLCSRPIPFRKGKWICFGLPSTHFDSSGIVLLDEFQLEISKAEQKFLIEDQSNLIKSNQKVTTFLAKTRKIPNNEIKELISSVAILKDLKISQVGLAEFKKLYIRTVRTPYIIFQTAGLDPKGINLIYSEISLALEKLGVIELNYPTNKARIFDIRSEFIELMPS